jgi:hypothetical protein
MYIFQVLKNGQWETWHQERLQSLTEALHIYMYYTYEVCISPGGDSNQRILGPDPMPSAWPPDWAWALHWSETPVQYVSTTPDARPWWRKVGGEGFERVAPREFPPLYLAWYSQAAADLYGTTFWWTPSGDEVEITAVAGGMTDTNFYQWPDKIQVGPVTHYIRKGHSGSKQGPDAQLQLTGTKSTPFQQNNDHTITNYN